MSWTTQRQPPTPAAAPQPPAPDVLTPSGVPAPTGRGNGAVATTASIRRAPSSLAAKLTLWYLLSTFVLIFATAALLYVGLRRSLSHEDDLFLGHLISVVRELIAEHPENSPEVRWEIESEWAARDLTRVYVRLM